MVSRSQQIRSHIARHGIDQFTFEDFQLVTSKVAIDPERLVLVGGQAIEVWGFLFGVKSPKGEPLALTEDADWLGSRQDAQWLCENLSEFASYDLQMPGDFDSTPSSALVFIKRGDKHYMMDFLRSIVGPSVEEVRKLAVTVELGGSRIQVMHPVLCMHSRMANLEVLESKRSGNGPIQARWMAEILGVYFQYLVAAHAPSIDVKKQCQKLAELAEYQSGRFCYVHFGLDPLTAIADSVIQYIGGAFAEKEWPRKIARIQAKRERWLTQHRRTSAP